MNGDYNMGKWQEIFVADKESIINIRLINLAADLEAGYNPDGACVRAQREAIEAYRAQFEAELDALALMDNARAERWCYYNLKKRGAIA